MNNPATTPVWLMLALSPLLAAEPAPGTLLENFDASPASQPPTNWVAAVTGDGQSDWKVVRDESAPSPPQVLRQGAAVPKPSFPLCLKTAPLLQDGFVETKFKTLSGSIDQAAGVVFRAQDSSNYYICRANALEDNVVLYKVQNGKRQALDIVGRKGGYGVDTKVTPAQWHTLRVQFVGTRFKVLLNSQPLFEVDDATFQKPGQVGLWTKADSVTDFDDFRCGPPVSAP